MLRRFAPSLVVLFLATAIHGAAFTPGNLVVYRMNDGVAPLANTGTAVFLDEYTTAGTLVQSIPVPTTTVGPQRRLVCSGTATSEGFLTRSTDGQYVVISGYDAALLQATITTSTSAAVPRVIGRVASNGTIDTTTALTDAISGGNPRSATSTNGTDLWISGTSTGGGVRYATFGATSSTSLAASPTNLRALGIFGGQLYVSASTGAFHLMTVGTGTPTTGGQTLTNLPGFPVTGSQYGFFFADLDAGVAGLDTLYVADDGGTINKYSLVAGSWTANGTIAVTTARGLTGTVSGSNVTLYITARTTLRTLTDTSGYNATITGTNTLLATAALNTAIQGVAFVPVAAPPPLPTLNINDFTQLETNAGTTTFTFNVTLTSPAPGGGVTFDIATADGTAQDDNPAISEDNDYVANSLTGQTIGAGLTGPYMFNVTVNGDTNNEANETFFVNVTNIVGATPSDTQGQGTINNDDGPPTLNITNVSQVEGAAGTTTFAFDVTLTGPAGPGGVTFDIATQDNTATDADNDYEINSLNGQSIAAGSSGPYTFNVTVNGDANPEPTETFFVNVTNIVGATPGDPQGLGTIQSDDAPADLTIDNVTQAETNSGTTIFTFTVSLSAPAPPAGVVFDIATAPDTALAGSDYVHKQELARTITSGNTTAQFTVTVNGDALFEGNETFFVNVTNVTGANVVDGQGVGTITNDDAAPTLTIADVAMAEGNAATQTMTFTVTITGAREGPVSVNVATADSSATLANLDYVTNGTTLNFAPIDTTQTFDVTFNGDTNAEGDEQFFVNLTGPTGGAVITDAQALGIIRLDDPFSINAVDTPFLENFDVLAQTTAAPANGAATTPVGWTLSEANANANFTYAAGTGSDTAGNTYSFGIAGTNPVTDRAFGGLQSGPLIPTIGAFYRNDTGVTITTLSIQYMGEEWRLGTVSRADRLDFKYSLDATSLASGTWTDFDALDFTTPVQTPVGAKDGNAPANRQARVGTISGLSIAPGSTFWIRYSDFNATSSDDGLAVDDFSIIANFAGAFLSIDDVSAFETNAGTTTFTFTVSLTQPAPGPGGVTYDIATQDGSATDANNDYEIINLTGENIAAGSSSKQYMITVNGDATPEPTEQFFVNVTNITGALPADTQGVGTIIDDDTPITLIHAIQGSGATSPMSGSVTIRGIVTGVKSNGFFVQEEDADADADPATSEGIFVFTSSTPPAAAAFTAQVQVSGTVAEFIPSADPNQPPSTELTSPTVVQLATAQTLPTPVTLTATFPNPAGAFDQLERVEHMRVSAASITVTGPSDGSFNESAGTGTSNGRFHGVVTGVARPFREPGIQEPDPVPSGSIPPIPRWDFNPERLRIESATINSQPILTVKSGDVVAPVTGPLDYSFRGYAIYPDGTLGTPVVTPGTLPTTVSVPAANEFTAASFNLQRFFDNVDDPIGDPVLTLTAYNNRLAKASIAIRNHLRNPDIIGVQEVEKLQVLNDLAAKILADGGPDYDAYLSEGNDVGGIDVGFLVKVDLVTGGVPRVTVNLVTQVGLTAQWTDPSDNALHTLNDRPPLVLDGVVNRTSTVNFPIIVIVNHLRSFIGIESEAPAGLTTEGDRVRKKRQAQAEFLANYIQGRQTSTPGEHIVLVGDFNAFEFNDGYTDVMNVIAGTPPPDNETVVPGDGVDLVNPDFVNLVNTPPAAERYSYVHEGNAQNIDHALVSAGVVTDTAARRIEHPRIDADYPDTERNNNATALRISDHDPVVAFLTTNALAIADFGVDVQHASGYATAGAATSYTIVVTNNGPDVAQGSLSFPLPAQMFFTSVVPPAGWTCPTQPTVGTSGTIACSHPAAALGTHTFTVNVTADAATPPSTVTSATATVSTTANDGVSGNNTDTQQVTILQPSQYRATKTVSGLFVPGSNVTYTITIFNDKPFTQGDNGGHELEDNLPSSLTLVSANATSGTTSNLGNSVRWNGSIASGSSVTITIVATINIGASGTVSNQAVTHDDFDNNGSNERVNTPSDDPGVGGTADPTNFTVVPAGVVSGTKSWSGTRVSGTNVTYTVVLTNAMSIAQANNPGDEFIDVLPAGLALVSATANSGTATPNTGTNTVTWNGALPASAQVTITIVATINAASGLISNQGTINFDADGNGSNESSGVTDDPSTGAANDPTTFTVIPSSAYTATKTVSGTFVTGTNVTYTVVLTNNLGFTLNNNPGDEFTDVLPSGVALVSANATSGTATPNTGTNTVTWNGSLASGASVTITITATITATTGTISNQGTARVDLDNNGTNETNIPTNDPGTGAAGDATSFQVSSTSQVTATKTAGASVGTVGSPVTYTIVITNNMPHAQGDNPGDEFVDVLPAQLTLVSANATSGTATTDVGSGTVHWNGSIPSGGSVTITINATINQRTGAISNQGTVFVDVDDNGTNEGNVLTDDPSAPGSGNPTVIAAAAGIPAMSPMMLMLLAAMLGAIAVIKMTK